MHSMKGSAVDRRLSDQDDEDGSDGARTLQRVGWRGEQRVPTTRNMLIYDDFFVAILENVINMHDL
jgi:hypothetical protein